jgi:hypothetical protein
MRALKAMVIGMGVLIIIGVIVLVVLVAQKSGDQIGGVLAEGKPPVAANVTLPAGAEILETRVGGERIVLRLRLADGNGRILILDAATGRLTGQTELTFR